MNRKFIICSLVLIILVCFAYTFSYQLGASKAPETEAVETEALASAANAGNPQKLYKYYLVEENGTITVYQDDKETLFEYTTIQIDTLPENLQIEIKHGKFLEGDKELYDFLENYSS